MPAKTGKQYIERLQKANNNVYIHGEKGEGCNGAPCL